MSTDGLKECSRCRELKEISEFSNEKKRKDGKCLFCRKCESIRNKKRYADNIKHCRQLNKEQRIKHRERNHKKHREWYLRNRELKLQQTSEYKRKNPEYWRIYRNEWTKKNPEKTRERRRRFLQTEKGKLAMKQNNHNRNARVRGAKGKHNYQEWENIKKEYGYTCVHCGKKEPEIKLTRDHIIPISKGGTNYITNIQPLCGKCNSKKHNKSESEVKKCRAIQKCLLL